MAFDAKQYQREYGKRRRADPVEKEKARWRLIRYSVRYLRRNGYTVTVVDPSGTEAMNNV